MRILHRYLAVRGLFLVGIPSYQAILPPLDTAPAIKMTYSGALVVPSVYGL